VFLKSLNIQLRAYWNSGFLQIWEDIKNDSN